MKLKETIKETGLSRTQINGLREKGYLPAVKKRGKGINGGGGGWDYDDWMIAQWKAEKKTMIGVMGNNYNTIYKTFKYFLKQKKCIENVIYVRESDGNKEKMDVQEKKVKDFVKKEYPDVKIHRIIREYGSAENENRPVFEGMIDDIFDRKIGYLFALRRDRFLRADIYPIESLCKRRGCSLIIIEDIGKDRDWKTVRDEDNYQQSLVYKKLLSGQGKKCAEIQKGYKREYERYKSYVIGESRKGNKVAKIAMKLYNKRNYKGALEVINNMK